MIAMTKTNAAEYLNYRLWYPERDYQLWIVVIIFPAMFFFHWLSYQQLLYICHMSAKEKSAAFQKRKKKFLYWT